MTYTKSALLISAIAALATINLSSCTDEKKHLRERTPQKSVAEPATAPEPPTNTIAFGGNVNFAHYINNSLFNDEMRADMFGDVRAMLKEADLALINGEGVITTGGRFTDNGDPAPEMHRTHPLMVDVLVDTGIDVVSVGNNHSNDYGSAAFREMLDRLRAAGVDYTGGGYDLKDAQKPAYRRIGDTVVAIVGVDFTGSASARAQAEKPGVLVLSEPGRGNKENGAVAQLEKVLNEARRYAHVVLLTPHWGREWNERPTEQMRRLATRLIQAGYDGILGHSAYFLHGVELIDGKPVIYSAGNLLIDSSGTDETHRSLLWTLSVDRRGITAMEGYPLWLEKNRATLAKKQVSAEILSALKQRSSQLGSALEVRDGKALLRCDPDRAHEQEVIHEFPRRVITAVRSAPSDTIIERLPADITRVDLQYDEGIQLLGYKLLLQELSPPVGAQAVALYWTAPERPKQSYWIHLEARGRHPVNGKPKTISRRHLPGDWLLPTTEWPPGKIVQDWTLLRFKLKPEGPVDFYAALVKNGIMNPSKSNRRLVDGGLLHLGRAQYTPGAKKLFDVWATFRQPNPQSNLQSNH